MTSKINSTKRTNKPTPLYHLYSSQQQQQQQPQITSPLGSGSNVPYSSMISTTSHHHNKRPRAKSVGKMVDQKQLAREESFLKLCGQLTPPPPPPPPLPQQQQQRYPTSTTSTPTRRLKKYPSSHDIQKINHHQKYFIHQPIPLPHSPISPRNHHHDDDDDDDDIPLAATLNKKIVHKPISTSLLNDQDDDDDDTDLIPIAILKQSNNKNNTEIYKSAADKYKEKVKEYLHIDHTSSTTIT
ncbi:hypothetical protein BJ944DRAFT_231542 [Cunninghamella echinulata]|nr:hypothetical protein BJ944DRAFT_231542 [Cunninghamella echinulata]